MDMVSNLQMGAPDSMNGNSMSSVNAGKTEKNVSKISDLGLLNWEDYHNHRLLYQ